MVRRTPWIVAAAVLLPLAPLPAQMQARAASDVFSVERYLDLEQVANPQISPDGTRIVYTRGYVNRVEDRVETALWIMNADGSRNRFLTRGSNPVWSPDGTRIAYLAEGDPKGNQVWVRYVDAEGAGTQVTRVAQSPANVQWSPDGKSLGFSAFVPSNPRWSIAMPAAPEGSHWTPAPRVVDRMHYRQDRQGFTEPGYTHLFVVPADGGTPRQLTSGDWYVGYRFDGLAQNVGWTWSPDGRTIVVEGLNTPDADLHYRDADLFAVDVASAAVHKLTPDRGTWRNPKYSPDGRWIAFTGTPFNRQTYHAEDLWVMPAGGGPMRKISGTDSQRFSAW